MSKVLTTFAFGPQSAFQDVALPALRRYAAAFDYTLFVPCEDWFTRFPAETAFSNLRGRPYSWWKLPLLHFLLTDGGFEEVLWLDADVVPGRFDADPAQAAAKHKGWKQAMAFHEVGVGEVPNCGAWLVNRHMKESLVEAWGLSQYLHHGWWEQAAVIQLMGGDPLSGRVKTGGTELSECTVKLDYSFNPHPHDRRGFWDNAVFRHATMLPDRLAAMRHWASLVA